MSTTTEYAGTYEVLTAAIESGELTQDQIDYLSFGMNIGEGIGEGYIPASADFLVKTMGDAAPSDLNRMHRALSGEMEDYTEETGQRRLLVEVCESDPAAAAEKLRALADRVAAGEITAGPSEAGTGDVRAAWQTRDDM